jgi:hypothetical protein
LHRRIDVYRCIQELIMSQQDRIHSVVRQRYGAIASGGGSCRNGASDCADVTLSDGDTLSGLSAGVSNLSLG